MLHRFIKLSLASASAMLFAASANVQADEIRIGVIAAFSGPYSNWGKQIQDATELYVAQHNGRAGEHTIKLIYRDVGGNNPARARQLAEELVVREKVQYVSGLEFTPTALAIADVATQSKVPFIIINAGTSGILARSPYMLRAGYTQWMVATPLAKWTAEQGASGWCWPWLIMRRAADALTSFKKSFNEEKGEIVGELKIPLNTSDFPRTCKRSRKRRRTMSTCSPRSVRCRWRSSRPLLIAVWTSPASNCWRLPKPKKANCRPMAMPPPAS